MAETPTAHEHRPGRKPLSRRQRQVFAIVLGLAVVALVAGGVILATTSGDAPPPRTLTLPDADKDAPPALIAAAKAVGFYPITAAGTGALEDAPAASAGSPSNPDLLAVGTQAPPFTLKTPAGKEVSLSDFRGKAVLLEIFATWCPHCVAEAPHLRDLANSMQGDKYAFVSINGNGEDAATVFAYHAYFALPFPALVDLDPNVSAATFPQHGSTGPVSRAYQTGYFPTFYVIDPEGRISWRSDGEQPDALLRQELERAAGT